MKVFFLGGTGSIGTAIVGELLARSHDVVGLSRSAQSDDKLETFGIRPMRGDLTNPGNWAEFAVSQDAVIQVAATFDDDMAEVDRRVVVALTGASSKIEKRVRLLYTGGCWLYGETGNEVATEDRRFDPLPAFSWMVDHGEYLLQNPNFSTVIIHPAMVYHDEGGVFEQLLSAAKAARPMEIWGSPDIRWPIVERSDLARAYCDLLERPDIVGHFNVSSEVGVRVGDIATTIAKAFESSTDMTTVGCDTLIKLHGAWAKGLTMDQQMSSKKITDAVGWEPKVTDYRKSDMFSR